ncbi:MAG: hypothetical protein DRJ03_07400 [Chloroflexi bacterium]|nr:MAG: hypothetical protein DRJ03_07400 [Chloroflexota bacterium]
MIIIIFFLFFNCFFAAYHIHTLVLKKSDHIKLHCAGFVLHLVCIAMRVTELAPLIPGGPV